MQPTTGCSVSSGPAHRNKSAQYVKVFVPLSGIWHHCMKCWAEQLIAVVPHFSCIPTFGVW